MVVNLFRFCPILDRNAILSPLDPLPRDSNWETFIGFDPYSTLHVVPSKFKECSSFCDASFLSYY